MRRSALLLAALAAAGLQLSAQTALTPDVLDRLAKASEPTPADRALRNAMARTSIAVLAADANALGAVTDADFTYEVPVRGITDQQQSGRCWLFTGLNVLRAEAIRRYSLPGLELSQAYLFFYDQLEKANLFLQGVIDTRRQPMDDRTVDWLFQNPLSDGGTFTGVADLVGKYGVVPKEAMPETFSANNTAQISMLLKWKLREMGLRLREAKGSDKQLEAQKVEMLGTVYHILTLAYGVPPTEFTWTQRDKDGRPVADSTALAGRATAKFTPTEFYRTLWGGHDLAADYVMVMDDPTRAYYKVYEIEFDRHTYDGHNWLYLNLPVAEIKPMAIASLRDTTAMYFSCDVGKYFDRKRGTLDLRNFDYAALLGTDFTMDKRERVITHSSGSSHAMTLIAVDVDTTTQTVHKWMVENSWGPDAGYKGKLIMTDEWFDNYMFRLVFDRKYVPARYLEMLKQKPTLLPAWDPMFAPEE